MRKSGKTRKPVLPLPFTRASQRRPYKVPVHTTKQTLSIPLPKLTSCRCKGRTHHGLQGICIPLTAPLKSHLLQISLSSLSAYSPRDKSHPSSVTPGDFGISL